MRRFTPRLLMSGLGLLFVCLVVFPIGFGLYQTVSDGSGWTLSLYSDLFGEGFNSTATAAWNSVVVSILTVLFGGGLGMLLALALALRRFPLRTPARAVAILPVAMPPLVGVISLLFVFGEGGILPRIVAMIAGVPPDTFALGGFAGIVAVHVYAFHVYTYLFVSDALRGIDGSILEAASILGAGPGRALFRVVLPELSPALVGAASLTFMSSMASFSAPFLFGGGMPFLTTLIYSTKLNGDMKLAGAQSTLLLVISLIFFVVLTLATRKGRRRAERKGAGMDRLPDFPRGVERIIATAAYAVLVLELLPVLTIVLISLAREGSWTWQLFPQAYTMENYLKLLSDSSVFEPVRNSLSMSIFAVVAAAGVGTGAAFMLAKGILRRFRDLLDPLLSSTFAIPGTVMAIFLLTAFSSSTLTEKGILLVGTYWILPLSYFIRTYPFVLRSASSALDSIDDSTMEAASMFGTGPLSNARQVIVPMILPGIIAGALLVLITSLGEFPSSILLYTHANRPISVEILSQLRSYNFGAAGAFSVVLLLLVLGFSGLARRISSNRRGDHHDLTF